MSAQNPRPIGVLGALLGLVGFSALAGVLVTAMVAPAIAVSSSTAKETVAIFDDLPDYLEIGQLNQRNVLWATQGGQPVPFATLYSQNRQQVGWDDVSQFAKDAALAAEDERFYTHGGVDLAGIARAAVNNVTTESGSQQGASTITQQVVKNVLLVEASRIEDEAARDAAIDAAQAGTLERKLKEAKLAIGLEKSQTKQEILLAYLNIAGFGGNTYGIEAAAQLYFNGTSARDLTLAQSATLVSIVQSPEANRPDYPENRERLKERRDLVLGNMLGQKMIDQAQYDEAIATPIDDSTIVLKSPQQGCANATAAKHFCDFVERNVKNLASLGSTEEERLGNWEIGGYDVYTTIDLDQQAAAEATLAKYTPATETRFQLGSAFSSIQAGTGQIRVMAQNKIYDPSETADSTKSSVNFNTDEAYGGSTGFQVGSTYKLFTLVNWLQQGHGLIESVNGTAPRNVTLPLGDCTPTVETSEPIRNWKVVNDSGGRGSRMTVTTATQGSVNAAFADMASKLSVCDIRATAQQMGVHRADGTELKLNSTMILGTDEIAPLTMANAYATVAAGGVLCQPIAVDRIVAADGTELPGQSADCAQAIAPDVAAAAATALKTVMAGGGTGSRANPNDGTPLIGKTGTADAFSTFLAASSTKLASAVWVGNIVGQQNLRRISVNGTNGGQIRFGIMREMLRSLDASVYNDGATQFPQATRALINGSTQPVPNVVGQTPAQAQGVVESLQLNFEVGETVASELPAGQIVSTDPPAGTAVSRGTVVRAQISDGSLAAVMPNVVGQNARDAAGAIAGAGLDPNLIQYTFQQSLPNERCRVAASNPAAGSATSKATAVTLTVNAGVLSNPGERPSC